MDERVIRALNRKTDREWDYKPTSQQYSEASPASTVGGVDLISRPGNNFGSRFPDLTESLAESLVAHSAILDGEVIARDGHVRPNFALLQRRLRVQRPSRTPVVHRPG
jgi:hypothetical protein